MEIDGYGLSARLLADVTGMSLDTTTRWKRTGRIPAAHHTLIQLRTTGDLGSLSADWRGWRLAGHRLWTPEDAELRPGDIRAIPYQLDLLRELQRQLARPQQYGLF